MTNDVRQLADDYHDHWMRTSPSWAHMVGDYRFADRYEDVSRAAEDDRITAAREFAARAAAIPDDGLSLQDRATRDVVAFQATSGADWAECRTQEFAVNPVFGPQVDLPLTVANLAMPTAAVAEAMVRKFHGIGQYLRDSAQRHREGVASGRTPAAFAVADTVPQLDAWLATPLTEDPLLATGRLPADVDAEAWRARLTEAIGDAVRPGLQEYRDVLVDEVAPHTRPDEQVRAQLAARRRADLRARPRGQHDDDPHGAGDPRPRPAPDRLPRGGVRHPRRGGPRHLRRAGGLPSACAPTRRCGTTTPPRSSRSARRPSPAPGPRCRTGSTGCPQPTARSAPRRTGRSASTTRRRTTAPAVASSTSTPPTRRPGDACEIEALSYHEGIPGHHLQLAIAAELTDMPALRRHTIFNAYAEGWGLYTERLADEMGLYSTPLTRLGMLTMDSVRACRLVVDTGLHALGWSRQQAIDYMVANSPMSTANVTSEVNRYAVLPGQACGYMVGRLEILRIRREAQERQGDAFDIKAFHDAVLDGGSVPLGVLDTIVRDRLPDLPPASQTLQASTRSHCHRCTVRDVAGMPRQPVAAAAARPAVRPEKMQPPRKVPSSAR